MGVKRKTQPKKAPQNGRPSPRENTSSMVAGTSEVFTWKKRPTQNSAIIQGNIWKNAMTICIYIHTYICIYIYGYI
jgi:hypothetical protein